MGAEYKDFLLSHCPLLAEARGKLKERDYDCEEKCRVCSATVNDKMVPKVPESPLIDPRKRFVAENLLDYYLTQESEMVFGGEGE